MRATARRACILLAATLWASFALPTVARAQMCVAYARSLTHFAITGDAWTWWDHAAPRYERSHRPIIGSVLVFRRTERLHQGPVSVVSAVNDERTIRVDHSWLPGHGLYRGMLVVDISPDNDWTMVRVWHPMTGELGLRGYETASSTRMSWRRSSAAGLRWP
jgi:hypothetical protein